VDLRRPFGLLVSDLQRRHLHSLTVLHKSQSIISKEFSSGQSRTTLNHSCQARYKSTSSSSRGITDPNNPAISGRIWKKIKDGAIHYWHGTKLLVSEVRISARLQTKLLHGGTLTRREKRQVTKLIYLINVWLTLIDSYIAQENYARPASSNPVRCLRGSSIYGIPSPRRFKTVPKYVAVNI
jgi:hypothetical protein